MCTLCDLLSLKASSFSQLAASAAEPIAPSPGAPGLGDSLYPNFGNAGYDVEKYTLDLNVKDVETSLLKGVTTIDAIATQDLSSFNLDFIGFDIASILVNGEPATFRRDGQELTVTPAEALAEGEAFTVRVTYNGSPEPIDSVAFTFPVPTGWVNYDGGSFVLSEPDGAANFYPVNDHPLDKAAYTFRITVPEPFEVAANGVLEETIDNGTSTTYVFEARDPMVSYLTTINIDDGFRLENDGEVDGIPVRNYFAEEIPKEKLKLFDLQPEMLSYFNDIFGRYPFELYGSVVVNAETGAALETQTLSIFGLDTLESSSLEETIAHELSHQWFGDSLALSDWSDIWLNESFATYSQGLWVEYSQGGTDALNEWVTDQYNFIAEDFDSLVVPGAPPSDDLFNAAVYEWGALGLHALRLEIGDEDFFDTLRTYVDRFQGGNVTPSDFVEVAEAVSGEDLNALFDRWFYSETLASIPELNLFAGSFGNDWQRGADADETYSGLNGNDTLYGGNGADTLIGNSGDDRLDGELGDDQLLAGEGNDAIYATQGTDFIDSGAGWDTIWLGEGATSILLETGESYDTVNNFRLGSTTFQVESVEDLSFTDGTYGAQIFQGDDLLAVAIQQAASTFSSNVSQIFSVA